MTELVQYECSDKVATLRLNRPEKLNAFTDEMVLALGDALHRFDLDADANVAVIVGNGRAFSSGADVHQRQLRSREEFERLGGPSARGAHSGDLLLKSVNWKPVISAVHGYVLGLAIGIVLDSDLVVAETGTRFQVTEVPRGLGGAVYWGLMDFENAGAFGTEVVLTGRYFTAEEALQANIISRVTPEGEFLQSALDLAARIAANPPLSVRSTVRTRRWYLEQRRRETLMMQQPWKLHLSEDFQESARAFAEKRKPEAYRGR